MKKIKDLSFDKNDIIEKLNNSKLNNDEKLIYGLFTLFPTRRAIDYRRMIILKNEPIDKLNNYYYNKKFYFYITKNKKEQIFDVPIELDNLINKDNYYLLGKEYSAPSLSKTIMLILNKIYGISISAVEIRRLYATYMSNKYTNFIERKDICDKMNHKIEENMKYAYY